MENSRQIAMKWWNSLASLRKTQICDTNIELIGSIRRHETLTGSEIEKLWRKECKEIEDKVFIELPPNFNNLCDKYFGGK